MTKSFSETYFDWSQLNLEKLWTATKETFYMTGYSLLFVLIIGIILGLLLFYLGRMKTPVGKILYTALSLVSNIFRSIPFIILIILLIPLTRLIVGTFLGAKAAIPALVITASPFFARLVEMAFREVDLGVIEAAEAMGASRWQIISKVLIPESLPAILSGITVTAITMIGFTAMAGAIGAGGLGGMAYQEGFQGRRMTIVLVATTLILLIVFVIQWLGDWAVKQVDKRSL